MDTPIRSITPEFAVAGQLYPADVPAVVAQGFKSLVCNRPDGEAGHSQPTSAEIERLAKAAGLAFYHLPVVSGAMTPEQAQSMKQILASAPSPVLAYCRSGARSAQLYSLALQSH